MSPWLAAARCMGALLCAGVLLVGGCTREAPSDPSNASGPDSSGAGATEPFALPALDQAADSVRLQILDRYRAANAPEADSAPGGRADAFGALGKVLMAAGYHESAKGAFARAQALAPSDAQWPYFLAHVHRLLNEPARAVTALEQARALSPSDVPTLTWLGEMHAASGHHDAAEPVLARALTLDPENAAAMAALGRVALVRSDPQRAIELLTGALARDPRATSLHYPLAMAYQRVGDRDRADAHLQQRGDGGVTRVDPLLQELETLLESAVAYDSAGRAALARGDWAAAEASFRHGLELAGEDSRMRATLHHRLGTTRAQVGDLPGAAREFERALTAQSDFAPARYSLGLLAASAGRTDEAIRQLNEALEAQPRYVEARVLLGDILRQLGRRGEALDHYELALAAAPGDAAARFGEGVTLTRLGRHDEAAARLARAVELHPGDPSLSLALARLLAAAPEASLRDGARARILSERVMGATPSLDALEVLAMALAESGDFEGAVRTQTEAVTRAERQAPHLLAHLRADLRLYQARRASRTPWHAEPMYVPPGVPN